MQAPQNAQDFIRALKAPSDPPHVGGPSKIDLARQAWDNTQLYVPNKAEAIVDWLLSRLLKDRSRERHENPLCDTRYWRLLADILSHSTTAKTGDRGHALRAWLVPLLNRIPLAPILLSYFERLSTSAQVDTFQSEIVLQCISLLWPLASPKVNPETLLECFGAVVQLAVSHDGSDVSCGPLLALDDHSALSAIVSSYRTSLSTSAAKRKLYALFLKRNFACWLYAAAWCCEGGAAMPSFVSDIYDAGIETIFGLDIIKQAADHKHDTSLSEAFEAARNESSGILFRCLPRLFESYVQNVKRHKGALFSQGSNQAPGHITEQLQRASMTFYASCVALARSDDSDLPWKCRVLLLEVVEKENLLCPRDDEAKALLRTDGDLAVEALASAWDEEHAGRTESAVQLLATLTRIDYDLMAPSFAVVYPRIMAVPGKTQSALHYLRQVLDYDSKARNLPSTIMHISEAFSPHYLQRIPGGPQVAYQKASAGPLTSLAFLDDLSRATHSFLTPSQVVETIDDVSRRLEEAYERFVEREVRASADRGDGPRKKRKKDVVHSRDGSELEYYAVSFTLVARAMITVLRAVPLHTLTEDVRAGANELMGKVYSEIAVRALRDSVRKPERREPWSWQLVTAGALRLQYGLALGHVSHNALDDKMTLTMLSHVGSDDMMPELVVQMLRTLLHQCSLGVLGSEAVLDKLLQYLELHTPNNRTAWTGKAYSLSAHSLGGIAVLHLLVDRWLLSFDAWANAKQLQRLSSILVNARQDCTESQLQPAITVYDVLRRMLHDAQFWELSRLRDAFVSQLREQTAILEDINIAQLMSSSDISSSVLEAAAPIAAVYEILVLVPPEYLPRASHSEFMKRGFTADIVVSAAIRSTTTATCSERHLFIIREVLRRTIGYLGSVENAVPKEYLDYLLEHGMDARGKQGSSEELASATMDLIDMYQGSLIRAAKRGSAKPAIDLVDRFTKAFSGDIDNITVRSSFLFIDTVVQGFAPADFPDEFLSALNALHGIMLAVCTPRLFSESSDREITLDYTILNIWSHLQFVGRWLNIEGETGVLGRKLTKALLSCNDVQKNLETLAPVVISILLGELQSSGETDHVEYVVVAYLSLARHCGDKGVASLESQLASALRTLPVPVFASILDIIHDGLPLHKGLPVEDVACLIRFSTTVLRDAPEGTSKICQAHITRSFNIFANDNQFAVIPTLRAEVLTFLVRQCSDRPAALRTVDLSSLWSLLRALLAGSVAHEQNTDPFIFHGVVNVLSALVRLRRDLVMNTLPHLGFVLRQLVSCLRTVRPQLGGKQRRLVMDTLPRWIAPTQSLSSQESRTLARLLTTLTTKTIVRTHGPSAESQKPESLVRPFSKHAAYVLTAYIEAVNDPLCTVSLAIRKELQPGMFALCDMLGEHNRDAVMVSALDAGGKATMKALWREYEKQRYVGKG